MNAEKSFQKNLNKLPFKAQKELLDLYYNPSKDNIEIVEDPQIEGVYAIKVVQGRSTFYLIWTKGGFDEVEFDSWPPVSKNLKLFI